jgi:hypothetical protein
MVRAIVHEMDGTVTANIVLNRSQTGLRDELAS